MAISGSPMRLITGRMRVNSSVSPELETAMTTSPLAIMPRSPCTPSAGCRKSAGVPVEAMVAAIFWQISPDLPMPVTTTRPLQARIISTARTNSPSIRSVRACDRLGLDAQDLACRFQNVTHGCKPFLDDGIDGQDLAQLPLDLVEGQAVGPVAQGPVGILVDFPEEAVDAGRHRRPRQRADELALSGGGGAGAARQLHRVSGVEDHRAAGLAHDRQGAHVDHQVVVAEGGAALGEEDVAVAGRFQLADRVLHVPRGEELPFLDVDDLPGGAGRGQQIGLPAEERRDLQDVEHLGRRGDLSDVVHIGENRQPEFALDPGEDLQPLVDARAAEGRRPRCGWPCHRRP